jgi:hypothetical protein
MEINTSAEIKSFSWTMSTKEITRCYVEILILYNVMRSTEKTADTTKLDIFLLKGENLLHLLYHI